MTVTVDVNVLLYASDASSRFHEQATAVLERLARGPGLVYLFWPTIMSYLRISTHPAVFASPLSLEEAVANVESLIGLPHVRCPGEGETFWGRFLDVARDAVPRGNLVSDAHLVALMRENGVRVIWTHDRDFRRFRGIEVRDPFG